MLLLPPVFHPALRRFGSAALTLFIAMTVLGGCGDDSTTEPGTTTDDRPPTELFGTWDYLAGFVFDANGTMTARSSVGGEIYFNNDMGWRNSRYISGIGAFGSGKFTVKRDTVYLNDSAGAGHLTYVFGLGSEVDSASGKTHKTLVLAQIRRPGESWFHYALRERK